MSYSRWLSSRWYTFWSASDAKKAEDEIFDVDCVMHFTYRQIKDDIEGCLEQVKDYYSKSHKMTFGGVLGIKKEEVCTKPNPPSEDEIDELRTYMKRFMTDVEGDHKDELLADLTKKHLETGDDKWLAQIKDMLKEEK